MSRTERDYFIELFAPLAQHGPGSDESTRKALMFALSRRLPVTRVLDVGCGAGRTSLLLAAEAGAVVDALDAHGPYLAALAAEATVRGLGERVRTVAADMGAPPFAVETFDLIWSEGAIYVIGVEVGLRVWAPLLKRGGRMAFSHLCWLGPARPEVAARFWARAYPAMRETKAIAALLPEVGLRLEHSFALPPTDWTEPYYKPLAERIDEFRKLYMHDPVALAVASAAAEEISVFKASQGAYSYVFFIAERV